MQIKINDLLSATKPILYETGSDEWPYAYAGTCFPVKYGKRLFIVSAIHCYENWKIKPESTLYPRPAIPSSFFAFDEQLKPTSTNINEEKYKDQIVLSVASSHHDLPEINAVQALDLNLQGNCCSLTSPIIKDVWLRGFPLENPIHAINYDDFRITQQAYCTNGFESARASEYQHCDWLKMKAPIPDSMKPNGMSGTPVYGVTCQGNAVYCGMLTHFQTFSRDYLLVRPEVLLEILRCMTAKPSNTPDRCAPADFFVTHERIL